MQTVKITALFVFAFLLRQPIIFLTFLVIDAIRKTDYDQIKVVDFDDVTLPQKVKIAQLDLLQRHYRREYSAAKSLDLLYKTLGFGFLLSAGVFVQGFLTIISSLSWIMRLLYISFFVYLYVFFRPKFKAPEFLEKFYSEDTKRTVQWLGQEITWINKEKKGIKEGYELTLSDRITRTILKH